MRLDILGVKIDNLTLDEILCSVRKFLQSGQHQIATVNPEFIMAAQKDDEFRNILNKCDLNVADGFGIVLAARRLRQRLTRRVTGVDLMWEICHIAEQNDQSIFLLGAQEGVAERAAIRMVKKYSNLKIAGAESGYRSWHRHLPDDKLADIINRRQPDILFVAFGQAKQEKWIYHNLPKLPSVKVAMGVGGSFDYVSGQVRRAPQFMRSLGLEWLYRLMRQPWRLPRIITAVVTFSWTVLWNKKHAVQ